ncbi:hypothetical protein CGMCC3_g9998 [Colletotrichum fructicola]|nr:uncharacterized protein CGMCC3_g9998 [Colletotrichum fructicola]KAE9574141.1 hypothetical protein CGMCC3_g9998 [Colletotrichum fructicola]
MRVGCDFGKRDCQCQVLVLGVFFPSAYLSAAA